MVTPQSELKYTISAGRMAEQRIDREEAFDRLNDAMVFIREALKEGLDVLIQTAPLQ